MSSSSSSSSITDDAGPAEHDAAIDLTSSCRRLLAPADSATVIHCVESTLSRSPKPRADSALIATPRSVPSNRPAAGVENDNRFPLEPPPATF